MGKSPIIGKVVRVENWFSMWRNANWKDSIDTEKIETREMSTAVYSNTEIYLWLRVSFQKTIFSLYICSCSILSFTDLHVTTDRDSDRYCFSQSVIERNSRNTSALKHYIQLILSTLLYCHLPHVAIHPWTIFLIARFPHPAYRENKIVGNHDGG